MKDNSKVPTLVTGWKRKALDLKQLYQAKFQTRGGGVGGGQRDFNRETMTQILTRELALGITRILRTL